MNDVLHGFAFERGDTSRETQALALYCNQMRMPRLFFAQAEDVPKGWIPSGSVVWCSAVLGRTVVPDYYPSFLSNYLHRKVWAQDDWPLGQHVFVKPADRHKRFNGFVSPGTMAKRKKGPFWCSEVVRFSNEWRYYVADGKVVAAYWYSGDEIAEPAPPPLEAALPAGWCGTVDMGMLDGGRLALVECHPPFAVGWYGGYRDAHIYAHWLCRGWAWLQRSRHLPGSV